MLLNILLVQLHLTATLLERARHRFQRTNDFVLLQLASLDILRVAVVCAFDGVIWTHRVVVGRDNLERVFSSTELTFDVPLYALLHHVFLEVSSWDALATLVRAGVQLVEAAPRLGVEMLSEHAQFARPLAAFLVVWAVHFESHHSLLEMDVSEMVEICLATLRARVVDGDAFLDAALAKVASTAHYLARVGQHSVTELTDKLFWDLARELIHWWTAVDFTVTQRHDLEVEGGKGEREV